MRHQDGGSIVVVSSLAQLCGAFIIDRIAAYGSFIKHVFVLIHLISDSHLAVSL